LHVAQVSRVLDHPGGFGIDPEIFGAEPPHPELIFTDFSDWHRRFGVQREASLNCGGEIHWVGGFSLNGLSSIIERHLIRHELPARLRDPEAEALLIEEAPLRLAGRAGPAPLVLDRLRGDLRLVGGAFRQGLQDEVWHRVERHAVHLRLDDRRDVVHHHALLHLLDVHVPPVLAPPQLQAAIVHGVILPHRVQLGPPHPVLQQLRFLLADPGTPRADRSRDLTRGRGLRRRAIPDWRRGPQAVPIAVADSHLAPVFHGVECLAQTLRPRFPDLAPPGERLSLAAGAGPVHRQLEGGGNDQMSGWIEDPLRFPATVEADRQRVPLRYRALLRLLLPALLTAIRINRHQLVALVRSRVTLNAAAESVWTPDPFSTWMS